MPEINAEDLLYGYMNGIFPMAEPDGTIYWYSPDPRAIIPIDSYKPSRSLRPIINKKHFEIRVNSDFEGVMRGCAGVRILSKEEEGTWISEEIIQAYVALHKGGLYGVSINGVFFGESMFSKESNSSKVAFHYLIHILQTNDFKLLDTQFMNDNVLRYGAIEIPRDEYMNRLQEGLASSRKFNGTPLTQ
jgi:leucyl/phenylalanyl-tRNA--protein transferase